MRVFGKIKAPLPVEHSMTYSTVTTGPNSHYYCHIRIDDGSGYMSLAVEADSPSSQLEAKQKAYEELGQVIDRYLRVYDRLTDEMGRKNAG